MVRWRILTLSVLALATVCTGCVRRTIAITSTPSEALVFVNDREIGRTPCEVDFLFYGQYDVRLKLDGYETIVGSGTASAPVWDFIGADLIVEVAPVNLESRIDWHFDFIPANNNHAELLARARQLQESARGEPLQDATVLPQQIAPASDASSAPPITEQGALPPKGSAEVPVPPTDLPSDVPGLPNGPAPK